MFEQSALTICTHQSGLTQIISGGLPAGNTPTRWGPARHADRQKMLCWYQLLRRFMPGLDIS